MCLCMYVCVCVCVLYVCDIKSKYQLKATVCVRPQYKTELQSNLCWKYVASSIDGITWSSENYLHHDLEQVCKEIIKKKQAFL